MYMYVCGGGDVHALRNNGQHSRVNDYSVT